MKSFRARLTLFFVFIFLFSFSASPLIHAADFKFPFSFGKKSKEKADTNEAKSENKSKSEEATGVGAAVSTGSQKTDETLGPDGSKAKNLTDLASPKNKEQQAFKAPESAKDVLKGSQSMETIMNAFEESLQENKKLRDQITGIGDTLSRGYVENNVLKARITKLEGERDQIKKSALDKERELGGRIERLEKQITDLEKANKKISSERLQSEAKSKAVEEQNQKINKLLDNTVLESERQDYKKLISDSQQAANRSMEAFANMNVDYQKMKVELANLYFTLGNTDFEERRYNLAIEKYQRVLELDPRVLAARYNLAIIYDYYLRDRQKAIQEYRKYLGMISAGKEMKKIRERVLSLELEQRAPSKEPLKTNFTTNEFRGN